MQQIRRIGPLSLAKVLGVLYAAIGLVIGAILALAGLVGAGLNGSAEAGGPLIGLTFGVGAIVFLPLLYGVLGVVLGLVIGALYNVVAGAMGGIEVEIG
jgi:hypothetical protein